MHKARRRKLQWALARLAVLIAACSFAFWPRPARITRESFRLLKEGMSRAEVEAILGPPGDYASGDTESDGAATGRDYESIMTVEAYLPRPRSSWQGDWNGDRIKIHVALNLEGKIFLAWCGPRQPVDHGPLGNLLWRAKRQWHWFAGR